MRRFLPLCAALLLSCPHGALAQSQVSFSTNSATGGSIQPGWDGGTCNTARQGAIRYNSAQTRLEFCNGTAWTVAAQVQSATPPTAPAGSGYFVLTNTTYNGNLGNLSGADAKCLTELTTNTTWAGYSTANANGQLVSGKVRAFLCRGNYGVCNQPTPLTSYYFARVGDASAGGASFTTDSSGNGPQNSAGWSGANYFSGSYDYWSQRTDFSGHTAWGIQGNQSTSDCTAWSSSSSAVSGFIGYSTYTDKFRWAAALDTCDKQKNLICIVNP